MANIENYTLKEKLIEINQIKEEIRQAIIDIGGSDYINATSPFMNFPSAIRNIHVDILYSCTMLESILFGTNITDTLTGKNDLTYLDLVPYLNLLTTNKNSLTDNLRTMGVTCSYTDTLENLVGKILDIPQITPPAPPEPFKYRALMISNFDLMYTSDVTRTVELNIEPDENREGYVKLYGTLDSTIPVWTGNTSICVFMHSLKVTYNNAGEPQVDRWSHAILDLPISTTAEQVSFTINRNIADLEAYENFYNVKNNLIYNYYDMYTEGQGATYYYPYSYFNSELSSSDFVKVDYYNIFDVTNNAVQQLRNSNIYWVFSSTGLYNSLTDFISNVIIFFDYANDYPFVDAFTQSMATVTGFVGQPGFKMWTMKEKDMFSEHRGLTQFAVNSTDATALEEARTEGQTAFYNKVQELQAKYMPEVILRGTLGDKFKVEWESIKISDTNLSGTGDIYPKLLNGTTSIRIKVYVYQTGGSVKTKTLTCTGTWFSLPTFNSIDRIEIEEV